MTTRPPFSIVCILFACTAPFLAACGRPATEVDCRLIVSKSVELEMSEGHKPTAEALAKRQEQVRTELTPRIKACIGRRVTDSLMGCVATATTSNALEGCLR